MFTFIEVVMVCLHSLSLFSREKKKEKDRDDLWKKLESLEMKGGNKNKLVNNVSS